MVDQIIYRNYRKGDEEQLADLFNLSFQMNGGSFIKTRKVVEWRYVNPPDFEPEMIQIAEDNEADKIVGAVYANLIEDINIEGKMYKMGDINDVSCHPDYTKRGIATTLMDNAIKYMKEKGCDFSMLTAAYNGHARKKIYLKKGYYDYVRENTFIYFPNVVKLIKDVPILALLFPALLMNSYFPRLVNRIKFKRRSFFRNISYEYVYNQDHFEFMNAINRIAPKYYSAYPVYNKVKFTWARIKVPSKRYQPLYIILRMNDEIIGGTALTYQNLYAFKFGVKIRVCIIHDLFFDETKFKSEQNINLGYKFLIDRIIKAATQRFIGVIIYSTPKNALKLNKALKESNFLSLTGGTIMVNSFKENVPFPYLSNPIFLPTYISLSFP